MHPMKNSSQMRMYEPKFQLICEAYQVLSNPQLKIIYEQYGEETLRTGIKGPDGGKKFSSQCSFQRRLPVLKQLLRDFRYFLFENEPFLRHLWQHRLWAGGLRFRDCIWGSKRTTSTKTWTNSLDSRCAFERILLRLIEVSYLLKISCWFGWTHC